MAGKHARRRKNAGTLSKAAAAAAALGIVSAAPAVAATAFTVRGTDILSPGDSPESIVPGIFAGYDVTPIDYAASPLGMDRSARAAAAAVGSAVDSTGGSKIVAGFSQGTIAIAYEKQRLMALPPDRRPAADELTFVTVADPTGPQGIMRWLPGRVPVIGVQPVDVPETPYDTVIINREYDGWADFPDRPWNVVSTANAVLGIVYVHGRYPELGLIDLDAVPAEDVTETTNSLGGKTTTYLVRTDKLPLVQPLRDLRVPEPIVQAIEQPLKQIVDAGYARNDTRPVTDSTADSTTSAAAPKVRHSFKATPGATNRSSDAADADSDPDAVEVESDAERPVDATPASDVNPAGDDRGASESGNESTAGNDREGSSGAAA